MNHSNHRLFATMFITGAAILIIEITAVRILSPFYGSSLYVLSSVLTIILGALSVGYWYGGKLSDKDYSINTLYSAITISGLFTLALLPFSNLILPTLSLKLPLDIGPLIFSLFLFFIPTFLLGIISPYIIKLQSLDTPLEKIGSMVGATFFWGTLGSIFGSLVTGFTLIPHLGITKTLFLVSFTLISLGILMPLFSKEPLHKRRLVIFLSLTIILTTLFCLQNINNDENYIYTDDGIYSSIKIKDSIIGERPIRQLLRDTNSSSAIYLDSKNLVSLVPRFVMLHKTLTPDLDNVLILGGGAYTLSRTLTNKYPDLKIDVVEIEPQLFDLAQKYFDLQDVSNITNHTVDARVFLRQASGEKYGLIYGDAFGTDQSVPFHLSTKEFYKLIDKNLSKDGVFILNTTGIPESNQPSLAGSVTKTLTSVFRNVKIYRTNSDLKEYQNIIFIARNSDLPINTNAWEIAKTVGKVYEIDPGDLNLNNEIILTDDHAPVELLVATQG